MKKSGFISKRIFRYLTFFLVFLTFLSLVGLWGLNQYLNSNKEKLIQQLDTLHGGVASFGAIKINIWQHFPKVSISIDSVTLNDSLYVQHQKPFLQLGEVRADLSISKILSDSLEIQKIYLEDGQINIFTDENGYSNLRSLFPKEAKKTTPDSSADKKEFKILTDNLQFDLSNITISFTNRLKYQSLVGTFNDLTIDIDQSADALVPYLYLDLNVKELAFNTRKGAFLKDSHLKGRLKAAIKDETIRIPITPLSINEQEFLVGADIFTNGINPNKIYIENHATNFSRSAKLLTDTIQEKIAPYQIKGIFPTKTVIEGTFRNGEKPRVTIDFSMNGLEAKVHGYLFEDLSLDGRYVNRLYDDERSLTEGHKNTRLELQKLATKYGSFSITAPKFTLLATPGNPRIKSNLNIKGRASAVSDWFDTEQFLFHRGTFELEAQVDGSLKEVRKMLGQSQANLTLRNLDVLYKPIDAIFPMDLLVLEKQKTEANFQIVSSQFNPIHALNLDGNLRNLPALLFDLSNQHVSSKVDIQAKKISWTEFLNYFGVQRNQDKRTKKTDSEKKKNLKETISGLHLNFHPRLSIELDTSTYFDKLHFTSLKTGLYFEDENTLVLEKTSFQYDEGLIELSACIDISDPHFTPFELNFRTEHLNLEKLLPTLDYFGIQLLANMDSLPNDLNLTIQHEGIINDSIGLIRKLNKGKIVFDDGQSGKIKGQILYEPTPNGLDTKVQFEGEPELINLFYDSEDFIFVGGQFEVAFSYVGDIKHIDQLVREAKVNLSIKNSDIHYKPVDVYFPLEELVVDAHQDTAYFNLTFKSDSLQRRLDLEGEFGNLHAFLLDEKNRSFLVKAEARSPKFFWPDLKMLIKQGTKNPKPKKERSPVRESVISLLHTFNPEFSVRFDTFIYSDQLTVENVQAQLELLENNQLELRKTGFTFHDGSMQLDAKLDLNETDKAPFDVEIQIDDLDIGSLMHNLDYLGVKALQEAKQLDGRLSMDLLLNGIFDSKREVLLVDETNCTMDFDLHDLELAGFKAIDAFAEKIHKERRFADLLFAPISNTLTIKGNTIHIPLMEIQSNAIHLFIEGEYAINGNSNIWISIPVNNLKKPNLNIIPEKTGYALARRKVHLEIKSEMDGSKVIKFRPSKRKFYKERGILKQYKVDKRKDRQIRRSAKKNKPD